MTIAVAIAFVLLNGLGIWQLQRLHWKETLIADMARTEAAAPVAADQLLAQARPAWRSAALPECTLYPQQLIYMHSEVDGTPGSRVLAPCPLQPGAPQMLVDLGFATAPLAFDKPIVIMPTGRLRPFEKPNAFVPLNRPADKDWYWRSATDAARFFKTPLRDDYFLVLDLKASQIDIAGLQQGPLSAPLPNRHLEYALTWFGLAWALIGIFTAVVLQRLRERVKS